MVSRSGVERFGLSPLIRTTLLSLYVALVLPLPLLAPHELRWWMAGGLLFGCLLYTSPSPRDVEESRMPSSA